MISSVTLAARRAPAWTVTAAALCAAVFLALAAVVALGGTTAIDLATIRLFQSVASGPLDLIANAHTVIGQLVVTLAAAAILAVVIWRVHGGYAWLAPALILATSGVELVFKLAIRHLGPPEEFIRASHNVLGIKGPPDAFPSGHVARITFLAVLIVALLPGRISAVLAVTLVVATVFLRVYIGDHWISDALAGAALGAGAGAVAVAWMRATSRPAPAAAASPERGVPPEPGAPAVSASR